MNRLRFTPEVNWNLIIYLITLIISLTTGYVTLSQEIKYNRESLQAHMEESKALHTHYLRADVYDARQRAIERRLDDMIADVKDIQKSLRELKR